MGKVHIDPGKLIGKQFKRGDRNMKILKTVGLSALVLVLVVIIAVVWLYQAGQDQSPSPVTKLPPVSSVPAEAY